MSDTGQPRTYRPGLVTRAQAFATAVPLALLNAGIQLADVLINSEATNRHARDFARMVRVNNEVAGGCPPELVSGDARRCLLEERIVQNEIIEEPTRGQDRRVVRGEYTP